MLSSDDAGKFKGSLGFSALSVETLPEFEPSVVRAIAALKKEAYTKLPKSIAFGYWPQLVVG